jgi:dihydropteroate synthase
MSRVRHYFSYDEALAEWRRFGLPENFMDRRRMLGSIFVVQDGMDREEAVRLQDAIKAKGGEAFLCRKIRSGKVMMVGAPFFFEQLAMDAGAVGHYGMEIASAIRNYHSDYTTPVPLAKRELRFDRTLVMGVLNVTPDSFSDGGSYDSTEVAVERAMQMAQEGADIIDIGGESTRPGAEPVAEKVEMDRILPVIEALAGRTTLPISVDTRHAKVADEALKRGAEIINDVSGLRDSKMIEVAASYGCGVVSMHMRDEPGTMQHNVHYEDLVGDIYHELNLSIQRAVEGGVAPERIMVDPGIGFGKTADHNLELLHRLREFRGLGRPLMVGTSRKSFIGTILGGTPEQRLEGSLATAVVAAMNGADIVRVHDVGPSVKALRMTDAVLRRKSRPY